ncbi:hypothetical protein BD289DRAFT_124351 [Coniella lustricola]|uniref:Uncharacterized protein n=1 Tax=Coniella lustricola TaxID=2025994 RepID=A0A2T3AFQ7_9PEZI|nr:hypothetical protein BD289DRAFT_124351 [Coniella lustricola]
MYAVGPRRQPGSRSRSGKHLHRTCQITAARSQLSCSACAEVPSIYKRGLMLLMRAGGWEVCVRPFPCVGEFPISHYRGEQDWNGGAARLCSAASTMMMMMMMPPFFPRPLAVHVHRTAGTCHDATCLEQVLLFIVLLTLTFCIRERDQPSSVSHDRPSGRDALSYCTHRNHNEHCNKNRLTSDLSHSELGLDSDQKTVLWRTKQCLLECARMLRRLVTQNHALLPSRISSK